MLMLGLVDLGHSDGEFALHDLAEGVAKPLDEDGPPFLGRQGRGRSAVGVEARDSTWWSVDVAVAQDERWTVVEARAVGRVAHPHVEGASVDVTKLDGFLALGGIGF